jgi:hypothetical protein
MILLSCFVDLLTGMVAHEASKPVQGLSSCWHCFNGVMFLIFIFDQFYVFNWFSVWVNLLL